jgi:hypothetical protein
LELGAELFETYLIEEHLRRPLSQSPRSHGGSIKYSYPPMLRPHCIDASPRVAFQTPRDLDAKLDSPTEIQASLLDAGIPFDPLAAPDASAGFPAQQSGTVDWDMQDVVWGNLPWDWNVLDDLQGVGGADGAWGWGQGSLGDGQVNGDGQQNENYGMAVL